MLGDGLGAVLLFDWVFSGFFTFLLIFERFGFGDVFGCLVGFLAPFLTFAGFSLPILWLWSRFMIFDSNIF